MEFLVLLNLLLFERMDCIQARSFARNHSIVSRALGETTSVVEMRNITYVIYIMARE
jgi:hypothetical protein